jgi:hypothetical protein
VISSGAAPRPTGFVRSAGIGNVERFARGAEIDVEDELKTFELPEVLVDCLRPPLEQLGFALGAERLPSGVLPRPLPYTLAKNGGMELAMLHLPSIFFGATSVVVLAANGLGYAFKRRSRLHLFAEDKDAVPQYLETAMRVWNGAGIVARFHPWMRIKELETAPDAAEFVTVMFDLAAGGGEGAKDDMASELTPDQFNALHGALHSAFPDVGVLRNMLRQKLNRGLDDIASAGTLPEMITDVIEEAQAGGWVLELVEGALQANPGSPRLRPVAESFGIPVPPADEAG